MLSMNDLDIKAIRMESGLTQPEFAKRLGVTTRTVQNWEAGGTIPETKRELLRAMLRPQQYFGGDVEQANVNGDNIKNNSVDVGKLLSLLQSKEQSLIKAQEHIDKLLVIIENLTKQQ